MSRKSCGLETSMRRVVFLSMLAMFFGVSTGTGAFAQFSHPRAISGKYAHATPDTEIMPEQYLLIGTATRGCGESQAAINPLNPNEIAVAAMCVVNSNEGKFEDTPSRNGSRSGRRFRATAARPLARHTG